MVDMFITVQLIKMLKFMVCKKLNNDSSLCMFNFNMDKILYKSEK